MQKVSTIELSNRVQPARLDCISDSHGDRSGKVIFGSAFHGTIQPTEPGVVGVKHLPDLIKLHSPKIAVVDAGSCTTSAYVRKEPRLVLVGFAHVAGFPEICDSRSAADAQAGRR